MKKLLLFIFTVLVNVNAHAVGEVADVDIFLKSGDTIFGYIKKNVLTTVPHYKVVTKNGDEVDFANIDSVVTRAYKQVYVPLKWIEHSEVPFREKDQTLLLRIYNGTNIEGYVTMSGHHRFMPTGAGTMHSYSSVGKFLYRVKGEEFAYAYYKQVPNDRDGNVRFTIKAGAKKCHPQIRAYAQTKEFKEKTKGIAKDPALVLPLLDEALGK